jgi:hypothetical protein
MLHSKGAILIKSIKAKQTRVQKPIQVSYRW